MSHVIRLASQQCRLAAAAGAVLATCIWQSQPVAAEDRPDLVPIGQHGTPGVCLPQRDPGINLAHLRLDGFVGLRAGDAVGTIVTRPFRLEGDRLQVNIDARTGEFKVAVLDATGQPLDGYSLDDAHGYRGVDD